MTHQSIFSFFLFLLFLHFSAKASIAQSPAAAPAQAPPKPITAPAKVPPAPPSLAPAAQISTTTGPIDIAKILSKAGHFTVFGRLLASTQTDTELNKLLNNTNNGITMFAPSDSAFGGLKAGTLNSMSDEQKAELVKFHIVPQFVAISQFQTQSNPIRTQAGTGGRVSLNVTTTGNSVNITTGLTNATITGTVYTDNQLAIYQVDKVLRPIDVFTPKPQAPAPAPTVEKPKKKGTGGDAEETPSASDQINNVSGGLSLFVEENVVLVAVGLVAGILCL